MIPAKFMQIAKFEYFSNVYKFIGLGEGRKLTPREVCGIKMNHQSVEDWFDQLGTIGRLRVMKYLRNEYELSMK